MSVKDFVKFALGIAADVGIFSHKKRELPKKVKKIIVLRFDFIGDVIMTTPTLHELKRKFPSAKIDIVIGSWCKDILKNNKDIDRIILFNNPFYNRKGKTSIYEIASFIRDIRKEEYDLAICFRGELSTSIFMYSIRAKFKIGYSSGKFNKFFDYSIKEKEDLDKEKKHEVERCLELVSFFGPNSKDQKLILNLSKGEKRFAERFFKKNGVRKNDFVIGIHPGASWNLKRWPEDYFAELINKLPQNTKVILFGTEQDAPLIDYINSKTGNKAIIAINLSLRNLLALVSKCDCYIGNDTGTTHLASALTRAICLFGPGYYERTKLFGEKNMTLRKNVKCAPCSYTLDANCPQGKKYCLALEKISVKDVLKCIRNIKVSKK